MKRASRRSRFRYVWLLGPKRWTLLAEASGALLGARLRSALLPFRRLAHHLGGLLPPAATPLLETAPIESDITEAIRAVRWAIPAAAARMPFRAACLQQAIAARAMLRRRGIGSVLHLGVGDPSGTMLEAHAWLDAGGLKVTGYPVDPALAEVGCFVWMPGA